VEWIVVSTKYRQKQKSAQQAGQQKSGQKVNLQILTASLTALVLTLASCGPLDLTRGQSEGSMPKGQYSKGQALRTLTASGAPPVVSGAPAAPGDLSFGNVNGVPLNSNSESRVSRIPSSVVRQIVSQIALKVLGRDFRFQTQVRWSTAKNSGLTEDLMLIADGDPTVGSNSQQFNKIASALKESGVKQIRGKIILLAADVRKDFAQLAASDIEAESGAELESSMCSNSVAQSYNYNKNCSMLRVTGSGSARWSDSSLKFPVQVGALPAPQSADQVTSQFGLSGNTNTKLTAQAVFDEAGRIDSYFIDGLWEVGQIEPALIPLAIPDVREWYGAELLKVLRVSGINVSTAEIFVPSKAENLNLLSGFKAKDGSRLGQNVGFQSVQVFSASISDLILKLNKDHSFFIAEALFKALGQADQASKEMDLRKAGARVAQEVLRAWLEKAGHGEYLGEIQILDGAGLSRNNQASARALSAILSQVSQLH
jgi:hypothetical protein